jgi:hypothetical protein
MDTNGSRSNRSTSRRRAWRIAVPKARAPARWSSSKARCPASACSATSRARRTTGSRGRCRHWRARAASGCARAARTSACTPGPVAAARCSTCTPAAQVAVKQRVLEDNLKHLGKVRPERLLRPIEGPAWGYRYRARLSVRYVHQEGHGAGRLPRAQVALRGRHVGLPGAAAARQRDAAALRELIGRWTSATACRRSSWRWATR